MADLYERVIGALGKHSISTHFQRPGQLVISCQSGPVWPDRGNSSWISNIGGDWYLSTWLPVCYHVPSAADIGALCVECLEHGDRAMYRVPAPLVRKYALAEISGSKFNDLFGSSDESESNGGT